VTETVDERLDRLIREFNKMLRKPEAIGIARNTPNHLTEFGLTLAEAKAWFKSVENFPHDIIKRDKKLTEESPLEVRSIRNLTRAEVLEELSPSYQTELE